MKRRELRIVQVAFVLLLMLGLPTVALADGSETLGPPSIPIASGTGIVAAGTGLENPPGVINVSVPGGASVQQVLLYWSGGGINGATDNTVTINGNSVTGTLIGGPTFFFNTGAGDAIWFSAYRADITGLGLVSSGANTLTVTNMDFGAGENNGAGVMVIYDDGSLPADIQVRDGLDLAFINFANPLNSTVPQTFNFAAASVDRTANLAMFFGSVSNRGFRPNSIEVTTSGVTTTFSNLLASLDGPQWDTLNLPINIPAGATSLTVQAFSRDDNNTGALPASFSWIGASLAVPTEPPDGGGGQGCTPGYWKQSQHFDSWVGYTTDQDYETVFGVDASFTKTLLGALGQGGGGQKALGRHATAALLNAANPDVDYLYTTAEIIAMVQSAYASGDFEGVKNQFEFQNELGCPID